MFAKNIGKVLEGVIVINVLRDVFFSIVVIDFISNFALPLHKHPFVLFKRPSENARYGIPRTYISLSRDFQKN